MRVSKAFISLRIKKMNENEENQNHSQREKVKSRDGNHSRNQSENINRSKHIKESKQTNEAKENKPQDDTINPSISAESCPILSLNIDCFDEIFDLLSLPDLHAFAGTCKAMQIVCGEYFKRNYKFSEKFSGVDGIYTIYSDDKLALNDRIQISCFNSYLKCISHYHDESESLRYIHGHIDEFTSLTHIYLVCLELNPSKMEYFQPILPKLEVLQLRQCRLNGDFFEILLKFCKNLKRLYIQCDVGDIIDENGTPWLQRTYSMLAHLQITTQYPFKIPELSAFLRQNPSVCSFSTSARCLWENRKELLESTVKMDKLEIQMLDNFFRIRIDIRSICDLLNELFERGFYKRLHLFVKRIDEKCSKKLISLSGLEDLSIRRFSECYDLIRLKNLKGLAILDGAKANEMEILAKNLTNLERLLIQNANVEDFLPFIQHSPTLTRFKVLPKNEHCNGNGAIDLVKMNEERQKLHGAWKITIYTTNHIFLKTKWNIKNGDINLDLIEMKRIDSYEWEQH